MRAVVFDRIGEPDQVLRIVEARTPQVSENSVLVRVIARPVHPADFAFVRGQYRLKPELPQAAGLEGAGVVVQAADESGVAEGTRVAFRAPGSWAEFAAVPRARLVEIPADIPDETACQISLNPVTAWALLRESGAARGDWIVVTAATSGVSNLIGALARVRGIRVIGLVRGDIDSARERCTAERLLAADSPLLPDGIARIVGAAGVAAVLDSVGGPAVQNLLATLAPGGQIVAYGVQDRRPAAVTNAVLVYSNLTWKGFGIDRWLWELGSQEARDMYSELWCLIRRGTLRLPVSSTHSLEAFQSALRADQQGGRRGKVILVS